MLTIRWISTPGQELTLSSEPMPRPVSPRDKPDESGPSPVVSGKRPRAERPGPELGINFPTMSTAGIIGRVCAVAALATGTAIFLMMISTSGCWEDSGQRRSGEMVAPLDLVEKVGGKRAKRGPAGKVAGSEIPPEPPVTRPLR